MTKETTTKIASLFDFIEYCDYKNYPCNDFKLYYMKNFFKDEFEIYLMKKKISSQTVFGYPILPYVFSVECCSCGGAMAEKYIFTEELTPEQFENLKEELSQKYGKYDEIKNFTNGVTIVWRVESDLYALNSKEFTKILYKYNMQCIFEALRYFRKYDLVIDIIDLIKLMINLDKEKYETTYDYGYIYDCAPYGEDELTEEEKRQFIEDLEAYYRGEYELELDFIDIPRVKMKNLFEDKDIYIMETETSEKFSSLYGQKISEYTNTIKSFINGLIAINMPFIEELTLEQYENVKKEMSKEHGEPDEIIDFKEGTVIIWYSQDMKDISYALNPKSIIIFIEDYVLYALDGYRISISNAEFVNLVANKSQNIS